MKIGNCNFFKKRRSIAFSWTAALLVIVLTQSVLLFGVLLFGGVLSQTKENAYQSFSEKTEERKNYLQGEMRNRFTNIDLYTEKISALLVPLEQSAAPMAESVDAFFKEASPVLISMLRASAATDAFVILDDDTEGDSTHSAIYFRDYDPLADNKQNSDLRLMIGPTEISQINKTMIGDSWKYGFALNEDNADFYQKPYDNAHLSTDAHLLGYWSKPFCLTANGEPAVTYSRPLFDGTGKVRGVIGIGVSLQYLNTFLPATVQDGDHPLGYIIGIKSGEEQPVQPLFASNASQTRVLDFEQAVTLSAYDEKTGIGKLQTHKTSQQIYACAKKLALYDNNTPFEQEEWYLIGLVDANSLLAFTHRIGQLLLFSFLISILLGVAYGILVGRRFTKPIISLVQRVRESEHSDALSLGKTGFSEIDELAEAIESANQTLMLQRDYDALTALCTNQLFKKEVAKLLQKGSETLRVAAMLMLDLDDFKQVNDTYGHHWGDIYLQTFARILRGAYPANAVVGRRSGDEFHVFVYGAQTQEEMLQRIRHLYASLAENALTRPDDSNIVIGMSMGLVWCDDRMDCDMLLRYADQALYAAKKNNKGSFMVGRAESSF
ncbi:MAG: sensor domain-containing diguanylate cyclase [Ruthenibacterium sp.]